MTLITPPNTSDVIIPKVKILFYQDKIKAVYCHCRWFIATPTGVGSLILKETEDNLETKYEGSRIREMSHIEFTTNWYCIIERL